MKNPSELQVSALQIQQGPNKALFSFAIDAKRLPEIATVSRIRRNESSSILGYQRPEVISHIKQIRNYLESDDPMMPSSVVIAFDSRVRFVPSGKKKTGDVSVTGDLFIPRDGETKPGWVVDGQQRIAAIHEAEIQSFPISVVAFVTGNEDEQRDQFILLNSSKPLSKGLIYELLPMTEAKLPSFLEKRRFPALLLDRLNYDKTSPFVGMIKTPTNPAGIVKDNSILKMLENSLSDGVLYRFRDPVTEENDLSGMLSVLSSYWSAISNVFAEAWGKPPRKSRLMHGAGIVSMGFLMDAISDRFRDQGVPSEEDFENDLKRFKKVCRWTDGYWEFGPGAQRKWNEIQNTPRDIQLLANYLLVKYKSLVWNRTFLEA